MELLGCNFKVFLVAKQGKLNFNEFRRHLFRAKQKLVDKLLSLDDIELQHLPDAHLDAEGVRFHLVCPVVFGDCS